MTPGFCATHNGVHPKLRTQHPRALATVVPAVQGSVDIEGQDARVHLEPVVRRRYDQQANDKASERQQRVCVEHKVVHSLLRPMWRLGPDDGVLSRVDGDATHYHVPR